MNPFTTTIPKLENVTEKYKFISTAQFIADVESLGYKLVRTAQPRKGLGLHAMVFTHPDMPTQPGMNLRLLAYNSHDGSAAFRLTVGLDVNVCSNAIVVAFPKLPQIRIVHVGYALNKVEAAIKEVWERFQLVLNQVTSLQAVNVTPKQAAKFLLLASKLRDVQPYRLIDLQRVRFAEQSDNNAWNVFNRVQDSIVRGGFTTQVENLRTLAFQPGPKARAVTNIREQVRLNTSLWEAAIETFLPTAA